MKLITFAELDDDHERHHIGVVVETPGKRQAYVIDLRKVAGALNLDELALRADMISLIGRGRDGITLAQELVARSVEVAAAKLPIDQIRILAPVPIPNSIRDCMEFERHIVQCTRTIVRRRFRPLAWLDMACDRVLGRGILRVPRIWYQQPIYSSSNWMADHLECCEIKSCVMASVLVVSYRTTRPDADPPISDSISVRVE